MPFINGRYYMNPVMGQALEAAREAEAQLAALENRATQNSAAGDEFDDEPNRVSATGSDADGPIHRVEIEAAEMVPAHSGRAARGFVARVHRQQEAPSRGGDAAALSPHAASGGSRAETHVFADHRDLVNFLRDELAKSSR
ncbi:MAG: hypothetical protein KGL75_12225 [Acidobacteriota bacterium]|nr:hypothetical protein [Acidobacteriota bacterium]